MADLTSEVLLTADVYNYLVNNIEADIDIIFKSCTQKSVNKSEEKSDSEQVSWS